MGLVDACIVLKSTFKFFFFLCRFCFSSPELTQFLTIISGVVFAIIETSWLLQFLGVMFQELKYLQN